MRRYLRLAGKNGMLGRAELVIGDGSGRIAAEIDSPIDSRLYIVSPELEVQELGAFLNGKKRIAAEYSGKAAFAVLVFGGEIIAYASVLQGFDASMLAGLFAQPAEYDEAVSTEDYSASDIQDTKDTQEQIIDETQDELELPANLALPDATEESNEDAEPYEDEPAPSYEAVPVSALPTLSFPHGFESIASIISTEYGVGVEGRDGWRFCRLPDDDSFMLGVKIACGRLSVIECARINEVCE